MQPAALVGAALVVLAAACWLAWAPATQPTPARDPGATANKGGRNGSGRGGVTDFDECEPPGASRFGSGFADALGTLPVRRVQWAGSHHDLVRAAQPALVTGSPADAWAAHGKWDAAFLSRAYARPLEGVHVSTESSHFVYSRPDDAPFQWTTSGGEGRKQGEQDGGWGGGSDPRPFQQPRYQTMTLPSMTQFWNLCSSSNNNNENNNNATRTFAYYSGQAIFEGSGEFLRDVTPYRQFVVEEDVRLVHDGHAPPTGDAKFAGNPDSVASSSAAAAAAVQANLWLGCAGVTAHLHYDAMQNFYAQVSGSKLFLLLPPGYAEACIPLRPQSHPSYRQAHGRDLATVPVAALRSLRACGARLGLGPPQVATLRPGDVLFLPAFWFHYVRACADSVSVNVWTAAGALATVADALADAPVPLELEWQPGQFLGGLSAFLSCAEEAAIISRGGGGGSSSSSSSSSNGNGGGDHRRGGSSQCSRPAVIRAAARAGTHPLARLLKLRWEPLFRPGGREGRGQDRRGAGASTARRLNRTCRRFRDAVSVVSAATSDDGGAGQRALPLLRLPGEGDGSDITLIGEAGQAHAVLAGSGHGGGDNDNDRANSGARETFGTAAQLQHLRSAAAAVGVIAQREPDAGVVRILLDNWYDQLWLAMVQLRLPVPAYIPQEAWVYCALRETHAELTAEGWRAAVGSRAAGD